MHVCIVYTCLAVGTSATVHVSAMPSRFERNAGVWHQRTAGQHGFSRDHHAAAARPMRVPIYGCSRFDCQATGARQIPVYNSVFCPRHNIPSACRAPGPHGHRVRPWRHYINVSLRDDGVSFTVNRTSTSVIHCLQLTCWKSAKININNSLQTLSKEICIPADYALNALETIFFRLMGDISLLSNSISNYVRCVKLTTGCIVLLFLRSLDVCRKAFILCS